MKKTSLVVSSLLALLSAVYSSGAANQTWTGGGQDYCGGTGGNWLGGVPPSAGDVLYFGGTIRNGSTNNFTAGTPFGGLIITEPAGPFILGGNSISLTGNL